MSTPSYKNTMLIATEAICDGITGSPQNYPRAAFYALPSQPVQPINTFSSRTAFVQRADSTSPSVLRGLTLPEKRRGAVAARDVLGYLVCDHVLQ